jgi:hypothetical protein
MNIKVYKLRSAKCDWYSLDTPVYREDDVQLIDVMEYQLPMGIESFNPGNWRVIDLYSGLFDTRPILYNWTLNYAINLKLVTKSDCDEGKSQ